MIRPNRNTELGLTLLIVVQAACTAYFIVDVIEDFRASGGEALHLGLELVANLGLVGAIAVEGRVLWAMLRREARSAEALSVAQGALSEIVEAKFAHWGLTPSEADVAGFTIKGFSIAEVAELRGSSEATIKTHLNAVYRKAGVAGRGQLVSVFVEDLFDGGVKRAS